jgi:DNA polymerase
LPQRGRLTTALFNNSRGAHGTNAHFFTMTLAIDFETYYEKDDYTVSDMGAWAYCHDPRFDAYLVSVCATDGFEWVGHPSVAPWDKFASYETWVSHNAAFDEEVYLAIVRLLGSLPAPKCWHCTADLMAYLQYPRSLKDACKEAFGITLDKGIRDRMAGGDLFAPSAKEANDYALTDARMCLKLWEQFSPRWPQNERELSRHTRHMGRRGIGVDRSGAQRAIDMLGLSLAEVESQIPWVARGLPPTSRNELFAECDRLKVDRPATTAEKNPLWQEWLDSHESKLPWVRGLNQWRKLNRTREVIAAMLDRSDATRLHYSLKYYGAAITGRWSGGEGLNLQNLNSKDTAGGIDLRGLLVPSPGKVFVISDLSQIEPRCMAVISGDEDMLTFLRSGADLYEAHARATMGYEDERPLKDVDKNLRSLAKARVLGLGYSCGADKFVTVAKIMAGLDITPSESSRIVAEFREQNPKITGLWARTGRKFFEASKKAVCTLKLRSGRVLRYFEPDNGEAVPVKGKQRKRFYGGLLVENLIQATARDVLADMVIKIEAAGIPVVLTVHDEVVCEVPEDQAHEALATVTRIMSTPPDWMPTLPVACEAKVETRYGK